MCCGKVSNTLDLRTKDKCAHHCGSPYNILINLYSMGNRIIFTGIPIFMTEMRFYTLYNKILFLLVYLLPTGISQQHYFNCAM